MFDTFDFIGGIFLGTFLGFLGMLVYHVRQIRHEARQNYVRLSLAQAEVTTLERTLEIHRHNSVVDYTEPAEPQGSATPASITPDDAFLIQPWMDSRGAGEGSLISEGTSTRVGET